MDYRAAETIIINDEEFILLLAAAGLSRWYGIELTKKAGFIDDESRVNRHLAALYRKGLVEWGADKARISDTAIPVMKILKDTSVCITCSGRSIPGLISGSYCSDGKIVMIERSIAGGDELMVTLMTAEEWYDFFSRNGFFPKVMESTDGPELPDQYNSDTDPAEDDLVSRFEIHSIPEGKMIEKLMLYDCGLYGMIIDDTMHNSIRKMFSPELMRSIMYSWAGGVSI